MALTGRLEVLNKAQLDSVHEASLDILSSTGIYFNCEEALDVFKKHGAKVEGKVVFITRSMIDTALKTCPSIYNYRARNTKNSMQHGIGQGKLLVSPCYGSPFVSEGGIQRPGTSADYIKFTKLVQACPSITVAGGVLTDLSDVDDELKELMMLYYSLKHSDKLILSFTGSKKKIERIFRLAEIAFDQGDALWNDYVLSVPICPSSPLKYEMIAAQSLIEYAKKGQPVYIVNCLMAGITSPISVLGTSIQQNSEFLAGLVLTQLVRPGTPVVYVPGSTTGNMKTASYANGSPEANICNIIGLQLAYRYNIPNRVMSGITDAKVVDYQAGMETMQNHLLLVAAGAQYLHNGVGTVDSLMAMSIPKFVLDAECIERIGIMMNGISFSEEEMYVDEIKDVGFHGSHLMHDNTLDNFHCRWRPPVSFSDSHKLWVEQGSKDVIKYAQEYADKLIAQAPENGVIDPVIDKRMQDFITNL